MQLRLLLGAAFLTLWALGVRAVFQMDRLEVRVEMASELAPTSAGTSSIQLFVDDGAGFREALSARATVLGGGRLETYRLSVDVDRDIRRLRLDPITGPGRLHLRSITVAFGGDRQHFAGADLDRWRPTHQLQDLADDEDLEFLSQGTDPRLVLDQEFFRTSGWARPWTGSELALVALAALLLLLLLGDSPARVPRWAVHTLAVAVPYGFFLVLNFRALAAWWIHDDPCLLAAALRSGALPHFFDPEVWRALSGSVLMPLTLLSFSVDHQLFGLEPTAFYAHQLLAFGVLFALAYMLLHRPLGPAASALGLTLFAVSAPTHAVAQRLMNRHYLEGLIFFLAALLFYLRSVRSGRLGFAVAGAVLYLVSTTAKEVFVPLVAVLPFLPVGEWRDRLRTAAVYAMAAALYLLWRLWMLGGANSLSGYAAKSDQFDLIDVGRVFSSLGLEPGQPFFLVACAVATAVVALAVVVVGQKDRRCYLLLAVMAVVLFGPLLGVLREAWPRYFFLPVFTASVLVASALSPWLAERRGATQRAVPAALGFILVLSLLHGVTRSPVWRNHGEAVEKHRREGLFVLESASEGLLLSGLGDPKFLACLVEIRRPPGGPGFCGDACWCPDAFPSSELFHDVAGRIAVIEPAAESALTRESCAEERDLSVDMSYDRVAGRLAWRLGPHSGREGSYEILLVTPGRGADSPNISPPVPLASSGDAALALVGPLRWIVRYRSAAGWRTYSPILTFDPDVGDLHWRRSGTNSQEAGTSRETPEV